MLNRIILIGRLTQDPELRYTQSGTAVASFSLAVERQRTSQTGERETDFINIVAWQKLGELCAQYLRKGRMAAVEGRLQIRQYENREGQKVRAAEVVADNVRFLDRGTDAAPSDPSGAQRAPEGAPARKSAAAPQRYQDDPFAEDGHALDYAEDDLPF